MRPSVPAVFIVGEDIAIRWTFESTARRAGLQPIAFASVREFLSHSRASLPSCLVLDAAASEDIDMIEEGVATQPDLPIIVVTEIGDVRMAVRAMKAGAAEVFTKPVSSNVLGPAIQKAIEQSRAAIHQQDRL